MSYTTWKITYTPYDENATDPWDDELEEELEDYYDVKVVKGIGDVKNNFEFKLNNGRGQYNDYFKPNDRIMIYRVINTDTITEDDLLMQGSVLDVPTQEDDKRNFIRVTGRDFTETILNAIAFVDASNLRVPDMLEEGLSFVSLYARNFAVTWNGDNPTLKTDGTQFPVVAERIFYRPFRDILERYSSQIRTGDEVGYYYFINRANELVWRPQSASTDSSFDTTNIPYKTLKTGKDISKVRNFIVIKGGSDPAGNPIQTFYQDVASINRHGLKFDIIITQNITGEDLVDQDRARDFGTDKEGSVDKFPDITGSAYTTSWNSVITGNVTGSFGSVTLVDGSPITIDTSSESNNKRAYTAVIRETVRELLKREAKGYVELNKFGRFKCDIESQLDELQWREGNNIMVNMPLLFSGPKTMRVKEVNYGTYTDVFSLEEDRGTL